MILYKIFSRKTMKDAMKLLMFKMMTVYSFKLSLLTKIKIRKAILNYKCLIIENHINDTIMEM